MSVTEASRLLQVQDKIIKSFPEVERVFGKAGRVAWLLPEGPKPYFRGRVTSLRYEFAQ